MRKKIIILETLLFIILQSVYVNAEKPKYVEIFDPKQDKVIKVVQLNPEIQSMVASWIFNIEGIYKNDPATDDGYVVKVPLDPAVKVSSESLNALVSEVYILIPENEPPCYLIFENENKLLSFGFNGDIGMLSKSLEFKLKKDNAKKLKKVFLGYISFEVPENFQVKTFFDKGAEITLNGERIAGIGLNKYEPSVPLESMVGNHVEFSKTKLNGYNFSVAYRLEVGIENPNPSKINDILRTVYFIFIDKEKNTTIKLSFDNKYTDEKILRLISKSVKATNKTR